MQVEPICLYCKHRNRETYDPVTCTVFPKGIPTEYLEGQSDHFEPHDSDGGIQFELAKDMDMPEVNELIQDRKASSG